MVRQFFIEIMERFDSPKAILGKFDSTGKISVKMLPV